MAPKLLTAAQQQSAMNILANILNPTNSNYKKL